jgi:hypothetical protein
MTSNDFIFSGKKMRIYTDANSTSLEGLIDQSKSILITDEHIFTAHTNFFSAWKTIVIPAG